MEWSSSIRRMRVRPSSDPCPTWHHLSFSFFKKIKNKK